MIFEDVVNYNGLSIQYVNNPQRDEPSLRGREGSKSKKKTIDGQKQILYRVLIAAFMEC